MSSNAQKQQPLGGWGKITAAIFGALFFSIACGLLLSIFLPMPVNNRLAIGGIAVAPIWVVAAIYTLMARNGLRAWGINLALTVLLFIPILINLSGQAQ